MNALKVTDEFIERCVIAIMMKRRETEPDKYQQDWPEFKVSNPERAAIWVSDVRVGLEAMLPLIRDELL